MTQPTRESKSEELLSGTEEVLRKVGESPTESDSRPTPDEDPPNRSLQLYLHPKARSPC